MPLRACGGGGEGICVGAPSAMSSAVSGTELENTSALTRRSVGCYYPSVNCGPARRCLLRFWFRQKRGCARRRRRGLSCVAMEFYCRVLRSSYVCRAVLSECFALDHAYCRGSVGAFWVGLRLLFDRTPNRTACDMFRFYSAGVGSAIRAFSRRYWVILLCWFTLGLDVSLWRSRRSTTGVRLYEKKRRIEWRFFRYGVLVRYDAAGSPLGAARPQTCAKEPMWKPHCGLSGLSSFDSRRGCLLRGAHSANA